MSCIFFQNKQNNRDWNCCWNALRSERVSARRKLRLGCYVRIAQDVICVRDGRRRGRGVQCIRYEDIGRVIWHHMTNVGGKYI